MIKLFFKHSFSYSFAQIFSRGISFFLIPIYTRILSPYDYGLIDMIMTFSAIALIVVPMEVNQGISRFLPEYDTGSRNAFISSTFWFVFISSFIFMVFSILTSKYLSLVFLGDIELNKLFIIGIMTIVLKMHFDFFQNILRYLLKPKIYVISSCIYSITSSILSIVLLVKFKYGVYAIFIGQISGYIIATIFSFIFSGIRLLLKIDFDKIKKVLSFSIPLLFSSISIIIAHYIDRFMIKSMIDLEAVGFYGIGFRFATIISIILIGLQNSLTPLIYNNYQKKETPSDISKIFNVFLLLAISMFLFFSGFSYELIKYFTSTKYVDSIPVIPFLIFSLVTSNLYIFTPGLFIEKKVKIISFINVIIVIENIILNLIFIKLLGITGAALATGISSLTNFIMFYIFGQKLYPIDFEWRKVFFSLIVAFLVINLIILCPINEVLFFVLKIVVFVISCLIIMRILDIKTGNIQKKPLLKR